MTENSVIFRYGAFILSESAFLSLAITVFLCLLAILAVNLSRHNFSGVAAAVEGLVIALEETIEEVVPGHSRLILPFIGTLWIFILVNNLLGLIPGLHSPTGDLSVTLALAILVFLSVHWFGIRSEGLMKYLRHYLEPNPLLLPFHLIGEVTRTAALAIRLFGNIVSLELAILLILMIAGFLVPIPLLMLHAIEAVIQAYIFGMLALVYIAGGIQSQQIRRKQEK